jgi:hypothetical protein
MKRWHQDHLRTHREWKKHYRTHVESNKLSNRVPGQDPFEIDCICDHQEGRFRKKHPLGCGKSRCYLCKSHKYPKRETTRKEWRSRLELKEQIEDLAVPGIGSTHPVSIRGFYH